MDQENAPPVPVVNASLLLSAFGYWPTFHDGEVHRALLDRGGSGKPPSVTLVIHAFDTDNTVDEKGYYRVLTSVLATLRFDDVRESELRDLGSQNVLSSLEFELDASGLVRVTLGPCYGLFGSLLCGEVTVISVVPWPSPTAGAPPVRKDPVVNRIDLLDMYRDLVAAVERAINEADPIGLLAGGAPSDEYAPEIGTIIPLLANAHRPDDVTGVLHGEFLRWFGEGTAGPRQAYEAPARQIWDALLEHRKSG